ncbi:hypothetical protein HII31_12388 [Pseudocercospora fuligena]|uniref:Glycoside hydrolase family 2 catalytic domain-containing protein n=1 Tax=Pseudocercospora fuligena TaxID=685502 RepID=A0A8H6VBN5_9PEZI|nr:hypothetical protein HII31_12388 [Pseudocercospora fuligena]
MVNESFNPGGHFPIPDKSSKPLLNLKIAPRMSIYLENEDHGSFLIDAAISHYVGEPIHDPNNEFEGESLTSRARSRAMGLKRDLEAASAGTQLSIRLSIGDKALKIKGSETIQLGKVAEVDFSFDDISARNEPHKVTLRAETKDGQKFSTSTELLRLPSKDKGTAVRIDNGYGGLDVRHFGKGSSDWKPIFPYSYYGVTIVQWDRYFDKSPDTLETFSKQGYNLIHIVPTGELGQSPFPWDKVEKYLDKAADLGLYLQYDVLYLEKGINEGLEEQVKRLRNHPSLLLWYIADEPDGKSVVPDYLPKGYKKLRSLDLYHPVSMALNCEDFYYKEYASGADIIMSDVYPVSTDTKHSNVYDTPCTETYGCCGCDNCEGHFEDVSDRLDKLSRFDELIGWQKVHWNVPQAFGNETFWTRFPTAAEVVVMTALGINHNAKGTVMWNFPTSDEIAHITDKLANVLTDDEVAEAVLKGDRHGDLKVQGAERIDAAVWSTGDNALAIVANLNHGNVDDVTVEMPSTIDAKAVSKTLWGNADWNVDGNKLRTSKLKGLGTSILWLR